MEKVTDTPPKPKRRRWRWLTVCALAFAVGVSSWWYWPRGDVRLVGRWRVEGEPSINTMILRFYRNGLSDDGSFIIPYRVKGDTLIVGNEQVPPLYGYYAPALDWWCGQFGPCYIPYTTESRSTITFDGPDKLLLLPEGTTQHRQLTRIPE
jgi:hypothetical protein